MYRGIDLIDGKSKDEMLHKFRSFCHFECVMIWCEREIASTNANEICLCISGRVWERARSREYVTGLLFTAARESDLLIPFLCIFVYYRGQIEQRSDYRVKMHWQFSLDDFFSFVWSWANTAVIASIKSRLIWEMKNANRMCWHMVERGVEHTSKLAAHCTHRESQVRKIHN